MDPDSSNYFVLLVVLILMSSFFATCEVALRSLNKVRVKQLLAEENHGVKSVNKYLDEPIDVLKSLMFGNTIVVIVATWLGTLMVVECWDEGIQIVCFLGILIFSFMIFEKIIPQVLGERYCDEIIIATIRIAIYFVYIFYPFIKFFNWLEKYFSKLVGKKPQDEECRLTEEEIISMVAAGQSNGTINQVEKNMIHGVIEFTDMVVNDVMIPRPDIVAVEKKVSYEDLMTIIRNEKFSRIPVYDATVDNILGVVHIKDLIFVSQKEKDDFLVVNYIRPTIYVPETKKIYELFMTMKKEKIHMTIVLDEYGGTAGIVSLEDLIEEIMGDIQDEHDTEEPLLKHSDDGTVEINASIRIEELNEKLGLNLICEEADTLGGLVFAVLDRVPTEGDRIEIEGMELAVQEMEGHRIEKLRLMEILKKPTL
ncbi:MAG: hemolysin family protein [Clostridia bacterium]|nr:hemolysin family protein [Clostridia bacterium]MDD4048058.1 hemolysin family protein [Clostridia bacterium]